MTRNQKWDALFLSAVAVVPGVLWGVVMFLWSIPETEFSGAGALALLGNFVLIPANLIATCYAATGLVVRVITGKWPSSWREFVLESFERVTTAIRESSKGGPQ